VRCRWYLLRSLLVWIRNRGHAESFELLKRVAQESNTPIAQIAQRVISGDHSVPVKYPR
jgi:AmiR/NasT family two-component response regulator